MPHNARQSDTPTDGEGAFLDWVRLRQARRMADGRDQHVLTPAGDDLAVLAPTAGQLLIGMDPVLDGVHVDLAAHGPGAMGRKCMNRNLSDVAAMAGTPVAAVLSIVLGQNQALDIAKGIYEGAEEAGDVFNCPVVGGDFSTWPGRTLATIAILATAEAPVHRTKPRVGQSLWVTGLLGGSILGRHLRFMPRIREAHQLCLSDKPCAMLDLSDGLSRDLPRLLGNDVGAIVEASAIPIHDDARKLAETTGRQPLWHALHDGEDYELLFATDECRLAGCTRIGTVTAEPGVFLRTGSLSEPLQALGWEHQLHGAKRVTNA